MKKVVTKENELNKAIKVLSDAMDKDNSFFRVYVDNISMMFQDKYNYYKKKHNKNYINNVDLKKIADEAATSFLNMWLDLKK